MRGVLGQWPRHALVNFGQSGLLSSNSGTHMCSVLASQVASVYQNSSTPTATMTPSRSAFRVKSISLSKNLCMRTRSYCALACTACSGICSANEVLFLSTAFFPRPLMHQNYDAAHFVVFQHVSLLFVDAELSGQRSINSGGQLHFVAVHVTSPC